MVIYLLTFKTGVSHAEQLPVPSDFESDNSVLIAPILPSTSPKTPPISRDCAEYVHLLKQYDWDVEIACEIIKHESNFNPNAVGDTHLKINDHQGMSCGLFQIRVLDGRPDCDTLKNVKTNIEWAYKLYQENYWSPWSVCKNGKVKCTS